MSTTRLDTLLINNAIGYIAEAMQVKKSEEELQRGFGAGTKLRLPGQVAVLAAKQKAAGVAEATIQVFGQADKAALARTMLLELVENKDQKQRQRQKARATMPALALCDYA